MAHEVETMFSVKETPWHRLGTVLKEYPRDAQHALELAGLDWEVETTPIFTQLIESIDGSERIRNIPVKGKKCVVRKDKTGEKRHLGIVSNHYKEIQNVQQLEFLDQALKGQGRIETAGSLKEGKVVWALARVSGDIVVAGVDQIHKYLLFSTSHDGSRAAAIKFTPIRVVCNNTLGWALNADRVGDSKSFTGFVRHRGDVEAKMKEIANLFSYVDEMSKKAGEQYELLARAKVTGKQFEEYLDGLFQIEYEEKDEENKHKCIREKDLLVEIGQKTANQMGTVRRLFDEGKGQDIPQIRHTGWAAYNAVTEYIDHTSGTEGGFGTRGDKLYTIGFGNGEVQRQRSIGLAFKHFVTN